MSNLPMYKGSLGIHEVKFVVQPRPSLIDGRGVGQATDGAHDLGLIAAGHDGWRLVIDAYFEASRAPVHELDRSVGLDLGDGPVHVFGDDVTAIKQAHRHVFALPGIAFDHLTLRLKARFSDLSHRHFLVACLNWRFYISGDLRSLGGQRGHK